jgi:uncharacterized protein YchJ
MTVYIANANGDWWQYVKGETLYVINTDEPEIQAGLEHEDVQVGQDKFEQFIQLYGTPVDIAKGAYKWD